MRKFFYARISTKDQVLDRQIVEAKNLGIEEKYIILEVASGKDFKRTEYQLLKRIPREGDISHLGATLGSGLAMIVIDLNDAAGWAGDLVTLIGDAIRTYKENSIMYPSVYHAAKELMAKKTGGSFSLADTLADVDAINIRSLVDSSNNENTLAEIMQSYFEKGGCKKRFTNFIKNRFGQEEYIYTEASDFLANESYLNNTVATILVQMLKKMFGVPEFTAEEANDVARAFSEYIIEQASKE